MIDAPTRNNTLLPAAIIGRSPGDFPANLTTAVLRALRTLLQGIAAAFPAAWRRNRYPPDNVLDDFRLFLPCRTHRGHGLIHTEFGRSPPRRPDTAILKFHTSGSFPANSLI